MQFKDYLYSRPDIELFTSDFEQLMDAFAKAEKAQDQLDFLQKINNLRNSFLTMYNLAFIRHSINSKDEFYERENQFFDENSPKYDEQNSRFYQLLLESPFRKIIEQKFGQQFFNLAQMSLQTFSKEIMEDLVQENRLSTEYMKIKALAQLEVNGKTYNLSNITALEEDPDRDLRKKAADAKWAFYADHQVEMEKIYDDLVAVRTQIARKLGFENYTELGYLRMNRSDYNQQMVAAFREAVQKYIVPIANQLYDKQKKRLGQKELKYYDLAFKFPSGNPQPTGSPDEIVEATAKMYKELSNETDDFFQFMTDRNLLDVVAKDGKSTGGYCTFIPNYGSPFIFSNFNGTSGDIVVMTHEAGHAFQVFSSRHTPLPEYQWPTYESAEIHSMSMEFFTFPWMDLFFEDADKFKYAHLIAAITFIPYGVAVDEFQHIVYNQPELSPKERNQAWLALQKKYLPHFDHAGNSFLEQGGFWQRQSHIFRSPFYYIDYALAQICAFQFWQRDQENHDAAWKDYVRLCQAGGSLSFLGLVDLAGLESPFDETVIRRIATHVDAYLSEIDDSGY
ncbi:MAG TPA: M3 family oligoendopeptidase [Saprospiraceae bacterium]|nr:M3 family oligoendopeptidase [Saprospiraceae bacterium]